MNEPTSPNKLNPLIPELNLSLSGFQVARREFFAHLNSPAIFFSQGKIGFNGPCVKSLPDVSHVQLLIAPEAKLIALRPSTSDEKDALRWCSGPNRTARSIACPAFFFKIYQLMGWNPDLRYKLLGKLIRSNGDRLMLFDLTQPVASKLATMRPVSDQTRKVIATALQDYYPETWVSQFGIPEGERQNSMQVSTFNGHVIFGMPPDPNELPSEKEASR